MVHMNDTGPRVKKCQWLDECTPLKISLCGKMDTQIPGSTINPWYLWKSGHRWPLVRMMMYVHTNKRRILWPSLLQATVQFRTQWSQTFSEIEVYLSKCSWSQAVTLFLTFYASFCEIVGIELGRIALQIFTPWKLRGLGIAGSLQGKPALSMEKGCKNCRETPW